MKFCGVSIETDDAPRLAAFYKTVFQEEPFVEGSHYAFGSISIWDPGDVRVSKDKNIWLSFRDADIDALYRRLQHEIPGIKILAPPERKPWGAYSFWFLDPDGNKLAVYQEEANASF
jgi:predicted enzyme related to lactoylglutathione lyase